MESPGSDDAVHLESVVTLVLANCPGGDRAEEPVDLAGRVSQPNESALHFAHPARSAGAPVAGTAGYGAGGPAFGVVARPRRDCLPVRPARRGGGRGREAEH